MIGGLAALLSFSGSLPVNFEYAMIDERGPADPHCKTTGDLNGDGYPDAIVASSRGGGLYWYEYPSWAKHPIDAAGSFTTDMQTADIDGDGDLDIIIPVKTKDVQELRWYENPRPHGNPATDSWAVHIIVDYARLGYPTLHDVEIGDLDRDGRLDIVIGRQEWKGPRGRNIPELIILFQEGAGRWEQAVVDRTYGEGTVLADIDGDGDLDIVRPGYWLEAPADPRKGTWARHEIVKGWPDQAGIAVADVNRNGLPDVLLAPAESEGRMSWFEAPANPKTGLWREHAIDNSVGFAHTFKVADIDGDSAADIVFAEMQQSKRKRVGWYRNLGRGKSWKLEVLATTGSHNIRVDDFDRDGDLDIFGSNWNTKNDPRLAPVELWRNRRNDARPLSLTRWTYIQVDSQRARFGDPDEPKWLRHFGLATGDVTGNGFDDIVSGRYFYRNPGGQMATPWHRATFPVNVDAMVLVDVEGNGRLGAIGERLPEVYWLKPEHASGEIWKAILVANIPATSHRNGQGYAVADIIKGGRQEVLLGSGKGIYCLRIPDNPGRGEWPVIPIAPEATDEGMATGDIDRDGHIDLIASYGDGTRVAWWRNPGDGSGNWKMHPVGRTHKLADRAAVCDITANGRLDIVFTEEASSMNATTWWFEQPVNPAGEWTRRAITTQYTTNSLGVADLDGDGTPEVVMAEHRGLKRVQIWKTPDRGTTWRQVVVSSGRENHLGARLADLDRDGDFDIIGIPWDNYPYLHVWRNDARYVLGGAATVATPVIDPAGGTSKGTFTVKIATPTPGAVIRYSVDGSEPNLNSALYAETLVIAGSAVVKARAFHSGMNASGTATASFETTYRYSDEPMP
jgi:hypothetical protein